MWFQMNIDDVQTDFHDTLLQEYSDSSDSGISSKFMTSAKFALKGFV